MINDPQYQITVEETIRKIVDHPDVLKRDELAATKFHRTPSFALTLAELQTLLNLAERYDVVRVTRESDEDFDPEDWHRKRGG